MKVFVTGGTGMVGRNLIEHAKAQAHEVVAPRRAQMDLTDAAETAAAVADAAPDMVIHCAGKVGGIQANIADPVGFLVENTDMGRNIVLAARAAGVPRLLNLGSSCIYPREAENPLRETQILTGELEPTNEGYALAKLMTARLCDYISREGRHSFKTLLPCNIFGPYDNFDLETSHFLPAMIRKLDDAVTLGRDEVEIWGAGTARREFLFAPDLADAIWTCAERFDALPQMMNLGMGRDLPIRDYYRIAAEVLGWQGRFTHDLTRPEGMARKLLDVSHQTALGWAPRTPLPEAIAATHAHYRAQAKAA
jgi:GDP-L-fucose synthase